MALYENHDTNLEEKDLLEVFEIDAALLRELLEEDQEGKDDKDHGNVEYMVESIEENINVHPDLRNREQEQQHQNCLDKYDCHDFEWLNMMDPTNPLNDGTMNWFSADIVGMVDFGFASKEYCYSPIYDGLVSNEPSYGCLWEDYNI